MGLLNRVDFGSCLIYSQCLFHANLIHSQGGVEMSDPTNLVERYLSAETATVYTAGREFRYDPCSMAGRPLFYAWQVTRGGRKNSQIHPAQSRHNERTT